MFNYLHSFLFLSETDNKFQSPNLETKLSIDTFSKLFSHSSQIVLDQFPLKHAFLILALTCGLKEKQTLNTFFHINTESEQ